MNGKRRVTGFEFDWRNQSEDLNTSTVTREILSFRVVIYVLSHKGTFHFIENVYCGHIVN